ncbi:MAG: 50S ribosomal protein L1 [Candidatus Marsarchaeota archaeon]|nr:50S ribosomal protein L1 [Candidatus Marsarchaeota archaeon]
MALSQEEFSKFMAENKGQRKFKQSVELAVNFKGIDFTKQDNRLNLEVMLPNGKGKTKKIAVFATDKALVEDAKKNNILVIDGAETVRIAADQARLNSLLDYDLFAQPNLMPTIAKSMGQFLGPRNSMPRPLLSNANLASIASDAGRRVSIRSKGKYLPTVHAVVGSEDMDPSKIFDNINEVMNRIKAKVGQNNIRSAYVKLTMSKPIKLM